jgi:hypothetical protein
LAWWPHGCQLSLIRSSTRITVLCLVPFHLTTATHRGRLASFNEGMAALHRDVVDLVPTG